MDNSSSNIAKLAELNQFQRASNGVYSASTEAADFAYSDGQATEKLLREILSNSRDLSSNSSELQAQIVDWPTEYHLSSTRANLLRPLDLSGVRRVLELGCGCGSITRYLGEQSDILVDSVEGSPVRAELAALRCADLPNVSISSANFNDIKLPQNYYDLVLFVGVTEYAGRFSSRATDQEALQDLLSMAAAASSERGVTLVAIENRTGLKYLLGASEDHYARPYVGIENYPDSTGIRTYTKSEWQQQIDTAGFSHHQFLYPFPDYKVPTLVLNDSIDQAALDKSLSIIKSRDYNSDFDLGSGEAHIWQGLAASNTLGEHANSFTILMSQNLAALQQISKFQVAEYPVPQLDYLQPGNGQTSHEAARLTAMSERLKESQAQLQHLQRHAQNLQQTIDIMSNSIGWRWLNTVRKLLRKKTLK